MKKFLKSTISALVIAPIFTCGTLTTSDKQEIAFYHYKTGHQEVVIIAPGFYNSKDAILLEELKDKLKGDYDVIMFDFRGHGKSTGVFYWTSKEESDLQAVLDYAKKSYRKIGLIAFSLGAATSINLLGKQDAVNTLIAISAPSEFSKIDYKFWNLDFKGDLIYTFSDEGRIGRGLRPGPFWLEKPRPIDSVSKIKCPILYIHGDKDWVIGAQHSKELYEKTKSKKELKIVKNGSHAEYLFKDDSAPQTIELIKSWLKTTLKDGGNK